jgi:Protein of unknown function (DUF2817)
MANEYFSGNYEGAREKFLAAANVARAQLKAFVHPLKGRSAEVLALDVAVVGEPSDQRLLVTSGCHGVEGHCGSGVQVAALRDEALLRAASAKRVQLIFAHALNPYGFSWGRRVNEDNVDLNRNFHDFSESLPVNDHYGPLHEILIPHEWPPSAENEALLRREFQTKGMGQMQGAITGGQYTHPDGLHFSGLAPVWSNTQTRRLLREYCHGAAHIAWIDLHSGLGPSGIAERIFSPIHWPEDAHLGPAMWERASRWWSSDGLTPLTRVGKDSASSDRIRGNIKAAGLWECPQAMFTKVTLEYGTLPPLAVLQAMRGEQWLQLHPQACPTLAKQLRQSLKDAFYVDTYEWKVSVVSQGLQAINQAIAGLK